MQTDFMNSLELHTDRPTFSKLEAAMTQELQQVAVEGQYFHFLADAGPAGECLCVSACVFVIFQYQASCVFGQVDVFQNVTETCLCVSRLNSNI